MFDAIILLQKFEYSLFIDLHIILFYFFYYPIFSISFQMNNMVHGENENTFLVRKGVPEFHYQERFLNKSRMKNRVLMSAEI